MQKLQVSWHNSWQNYRGRQALGLRLGIVLLLTLALALGYAQKSIAVYPFESEDGLLGLALADRFYQGVAESGAFEVGLEPLATLSLIPPINVEGGYRSPLIILRPKDNHLLANFDALSMVQDSLGVDVAVTAAVEVVSEGLLQLDLYIASTERSHYLLSAPEDSPELLVDSALRVLGSHLSQTLDVANTPAFSLEGDYGDYMQVLAMLSSGFAIGAQESLETLLESDEAEDSWQVLSDDLMALNEGKPGSNSARMAALALSISNLEHQDLLRYVEAFAKDSGLALAYIWSANLKDNVNDRNGANKDFDKAATYPFGVAARASYRAVNGFNGARADILKAFGSESRSALVAASFAAQLLEDNALEKQVLHKISRLSPALAYSFERLSFIAFDEENALAAAEALVAAVALEPDSDLYWTNLGWAYYLLGFLAESEEASIKASDLDPTQEIALFNLGLSYAVRGRLEEAMTVYAKAIAVDPEVNDEAIIDLVNALDLYPQEPSVHFALASLYEAEGQEDKALEEFNHYVALGKDANFLRQADQRISVLTAPPARLFINDAFQLALAGDLGEVESFMPGDRMALVFEIYTDGLELPSNITLKVDLFDSEGKEQDFAGYSRSLSIPQNSVAFEVRDGSFDLPLILKAGEYSLRLSLASEGEVAQRSLNFRLAGEPILLRQLLSRNIILRNLEGSGALYGATMMRGANADTNLIAALMAELRRSAELAENALPMIEEGRFAEFSGSKLFLESSAEDIRDFLSYVLATGTAEVSFSFVDAYAQWAIDGAPVDF
ncbi:MAG: tetratricopeptide repeat protein [Deinococcales bacterium]